MMSRPNADDYGSHFTQYVSLAKGESVAELIAMHSEPLIHFIEALPDEKAGYAYAENKWTLKGALQHLIDAEHIFAYRALAIARGETQELPGFDEVAYGAAQRAERRSFDDLKEEFKAVRYANNMLFRSFDEEALKTKCIVAGVPASCEAWIFICFGHALHHLTIFENRYLS